MRFFSLLTVLPLLAFAPASHAAGQMGGADNSYTAMCIKSADMPAPFGEADLKGNPQLAAYCGCFDKAFTARAMKAAQGGSKGTLEQHMKEERAMRNSCRKQFGLPAAPAEPGTK